MMGMVNRQMIHAMAPWVERVCISECSASGRATHTYRNSTAADHMTVASGLNAGVVR